MSYESQEPLGINIGPDSYKLARESMTEREQLAAIRAHPAYDESIEALVESILHSEHYEFVTEELHIVLCNLRRTEWDAIAASVGRIHDDTAEKSMNIVE